MQYDTLPIKPNANNNKPIRTRENMQPAPSAGKRAGVFILLLIG